MSETLNNVHREALGLLKIVHRFCVDEGIKYTISAGTLLNYGKIPFSQNPPIIYIDIMYDGFQKLESFLKKFCLDNEGYSIHNFENTTQFNTLDMWFVKHSRVKLPGKRSEDEFYYGARLVITPLFYAGNTRKEWFKLYREYRKSILPLTLCAQLPNKPLSSRIKLAPKRITAWYYIRSRDRYSIAGIKDMLAEIPESKYILYPRIASKFKKPNIIAWVVKPEAMELTRTVWNDIRRIELCGVETLSISDVDKYRKCFSKEYLEGISLPKSHLLLDGGETLRRIQLIQTEMLVEFDRICRKNGLRYNISFGTLLGAVRHGGFIPWDDDIDVTMPWEDYMKLDKAMECDLDAEKYYFRTPETEENNHLIFKHLERKGTVYTKPGRNKLKKQIGVFIDIFPMYPAAPNAFLDWFHARVCRFWRTALWSTVGAESEKNRVKRAYYRQTAKLGNKRCYASFVKAATFFKNKKGRLKFWIAMDRNPYNVPLVQEGNYNDTIELEFEGHKFLAPRNYKGVLQYCFGTDWRLYSGANSRTPSHEAVIDIGKLYEFNDEVVTR